MRDIDSFDAFTAQINARRAAVREPMAAPMAMPAPKATKATPKGKGTPKGKRTRAPRIVRDAAVEWCTERGIGRYGETTASRADARARLDAARAAHGLAPVTYKV